MKGRKSVNILVPNYSNKHVTFNKGEYIGHLENIDKEENSHHQEKSDAHAMGSVTTKKMMSEQVEPDGFDPPCQKPNPNIKAKLETLLKDYESQFMRDETAIGTTPLTNMSIDMGVLGPVLQKPYLITMKHYQWVKDEIAKLLTGKVIRGSRSSWTVPIIVLPMGD